VRARRDGALAWIVGFGPAVAWVTALTLHYGPTRGYAPVILVALLSGLGVLGLSALTLAYLPAGLERAGLRRAAAALRRAWDRDAL
jgi:hypothetical protein